MSAAGQALAGINLSHFILINVREVGSATGTNSFHHLAASHYLGRPLHTQDVSKHS